MSHLVGPSPMSPRESGRSSRRTPASRLNSPQLIVNYFGQQAAPVGHFCRSAREEEEAGRRRAGDRPCPAAGGTTGSEAAGGGGDRTGQERTALHPGPVLKHPEEPSGAAEAGSGHRVRRRGLCCRGQHRGGRCPPLKGGARAGGARKAPRSLPAAEWRRRVTCARPSRAGLGRCGAGGGGGRSALPRERRGGATCPTRPVSKVPALPRLRDAHLPPHDSRPPLPPPFSPWQPGGAPFPVGRVGARGGGATVVAA